MNNDYKENEFIDVKKKRGFNKRIISYILVGVLSASLGGTLSTIATIKYYNNKTATEYISPTNPSTNKPSAAPVAMSVSNIAKQVGPAVVGVSTKSISDRKSVV